MKTKRSLFHLVWLLVLILSGLAACTDHFTLPDTPGSVPSRLRVRSLTLDLPSNQSKVSLFRYDGQNRLSSIITYQTPDSTVAPVEYSTYQYGGQNQLTQVRREIVLRPTGNAPNPVERYDFGYNAAGQVARLEYGTELGIFSVSLFYNGTNQLKSSTRSFSTGGLSWSQNDELTLTGDNITSVNRETRLIFKGGPPMISGETVSLTYDNKRNPFNGVYVIPAPYPGFPFNPGTSGNFFYYAYYGGVSNLFNLSPNNLLTNGPATSYQYTYNAADLPTVRQTITSGAVTETVRFEYEPY